MCVGWESNQECLEMFVMTVFQKITDGRARKRFEEQLGSPCGK